MSGRRNLPYGVTNQMRQSRSRLAERRGTRSTLGRIRGTACDPATSKSPGSPTDAELRPWRMPLTVRDVGFSICGNSQHSSVTHLPQGLIRGVLKHGHGEPAIELLLQPKHFVKSWAGQQADPELRVDGHTSCATMQVDHRTLVSDKIHKNQSLSSIHRPPPLAGSLIGVDSLNTSFLKERPSRMQLSTSTTRVKLPEATMTVVADSRMSWEVVQLGGMHH
jgi:hypothetical protein